MFKQIMVPVDLTHQDHLTRAIAVATTLAKQFGAAMTFVGVTTNTPSSVAHTPEEYKTKLADFAAAQSAASGVPASSYAIVAHDPSIDLNKHLLAAVEETGADLVVMQSHIPGIADYIWSSHGGHLADHAKVSVMLIR